MIRVYSVMQHNTWACPGALYAINENNEIVWIQANPTNDMTRSYFDEDRDVFRIYDYQSATLVQEYEE